MDLSSSRILTTVVEPNPTGREPSSPTTADLRVSSSRSTYLRYPSFLYLLCLPPPRPVHRNMASNGGDPSGFVGKPSFALVAPIHPVIPPHRAIEGEFTLLAAWSFLLLHTSRCYEGLGCNPKPELVIVACLPRICTFGVQ